MKKATHALAFVMGSFLTTTAAAAPANVPEEPGVNDRSLFYEFKLIVQKGGTFTDISNYPSISRSGLVAFQAKNSTTGEGVWASDGTVITDLTPGFDGNSRTFSRAMLSDNGYAIESDTFSGPPLLTFVRIWRNGVQTIYAQSGAGQAYDSVLGNPALSANSNFYAFTGLITGSSVPRLTTPLGQAMLLGNLGVEYFPVVADDGAVVLRDSNIALQAIDYFWGGIAPASDTVASSGDGFTELGNQPGLSDSGKIVAWSGDRGNGPGVFIAYAELLPGWTQVRVAGEGAAVQGNRPDLGFDDAGDPLYFSNIDYDSRVAVMHQEREPAGLYGDTVIVAFKGTPNGDSVYPRFGFYPGLFFHQAIGIWTVRLDFASDTSRPLEARKRYAIPVVESGDTLSGDGIDDFVVSGLTIGDSLAEATTDDSGQALDYPAGSHRIAFTATNPAGEKVIVRATHVNSCLLTVRHYSQCDFAWTDKPYLDSGENFCTKACALTSQTVAADYAADFYDIDTSYTPAEVHDFIRPLGGFAGNNVDWSRSIQALRQSPGLLSLKPNTLRFVSERHSVLPTSSPATVQAAFDYIDGNLCDDSNPAPVLIGADREFDDDGKLVPGHFVVAAGRVNSRHFIVDVGYRNGILFSQGPEGNPISESYETNFETRGVVVDPADVGSMTISVNGDATFVIKDSSERQAGFEAGSEEPLQEIPGGTFFYDGLRDLGTQNAIEDVASVFTTPTSGIIPYSVTVIGTQTGDFNMAVDVIDPDGSLNAPVSLTDSITLGQSKTYLITPDNGKIIIDSDSDADGVIDSEDNCTLVANPDQRDTNADGYGNICDPDLTNDGIVNFGDLGVMRGAFFGTNADADLDGSGFVNFTDVGIMKAFFFKPPGPSGVVASD